MKSALGGRTCERKDGRLLTPGEVAVMFRVDPKTVTRWGKEGRLPHITTPGGHYRFPEADVLALLPRQKQADVGGGE